MIFKVGMQIYNIHTGETTHIVELHKVKNENGRWRRYTLANGQIWIEQELRAHWKKKTK